MEKIFIIVSIIAVIMTGSSELEKNQQILNQQTSNQQALNAYQEFLDGKRGIYVDDNTDYGNSHYNELELEKKTEYYLDELLQMITDNIWEDGNCNTTIKELQYAYMDCGNDGLQELVLRFLGLDIYAKDDDSDFTCVIVYEKDKLFMRYGVSSWARSNTELYYYGYLAGFGSEGAGDHIAEEQILDKKGKVNIIYEAEILSGSFYVSWIDGELYRSVFDINEEIDIEVTIYRMKDEQYYTCTVDESETERCNEFIKLCKQKGMQFVTEEEMKEIIRQRKAAMGIDESLLEPVTLEWNTVDNSLYKKYIER